MQGNKVLFIGLVWPEPNSSAAGTRIIQLIQLFIAHQYEVTFASAATKSEFSFDLNGIDVTEQEIKLNDESFNDFLKTFAPSIVVFDRFMIEEQYGWRVQQECPNALRILDTEDLHFLRHARQQATKKNAELKPSDLFTDVAKREIAAILRCDLSLIISEIEMDILKDQFQINPALIHYLPFLEEEITAAAVANWKSFEARAGFVFMGNFLHEPNWHTLQVLKTKIWPRLSQRLPKATLSIYGAYPSQKVWQLNQEKEQFLVLGRAENARKTIAKHRVLLAPIAFGAGVKGKFIDAMQVGTPSVTTTIGAEAMKGELNWNGAIADDMEQFINEAVNLYQDKNLWLQAQQNGIEIINQRYSKAKFSHLLMEKIQSLRNSLSAHRRQNFFGQLLQYHTLQSTKYMSLWIEEKNKSR